MLDGTLPVIRVGTVIQALMLDAVARDGLGDRVMAERDIECALDAAEPDSLDLSVDRRAGTGPP